MKKIIVVVVMLLLNLQLFADDSFLERSEFGLYGGANINFQTPDFDFRDSVVFDNNATSLHLNFGALYSYRINDMFTVSGRLGFNGLSSVLDGSDSVASEMDASLSYVEFSPMLHIHNLIPVKNLYLLGGLEFGFPVSSNYELGTIAEDIPDASARLALALGAGYKYELRDNLFLSPELSFRLPFNDVSSNDNFNSWNVPQLRLGVSLTFGFAEEKEPNKVEGLEVGFKDVYYLDKNGDRNNLERITVEQHNYGELFPLVPYIFYDEGSKVPDTDYQNLSMQVETGGFIMADMKPDAMNINSHTLDIIGNRMADYPDTKLSITGTIAGDSEDIDLAHQRADFAKDYLVMNYQIEQERITAKASEKPSKPSSYKVPEGIEENRRLELEGSEKLMEPIMIQKEDRTIPNPDIIVFEPYAETNLPISKWDLYLFQADREIEHFTGIGSPTELTWNIKPNELEASNIPVDYVLNVNTRDGKEASETGSIPVDFISKSRMKSERRANKTITKFSLVVFDFDSPEVSAHDKKILDKYVIPEIKLNSDVQIYGYSDKIGSESYNRKLALQRAENVMEYIRSKRKDVNYEVHGVGESVEIFDNNTPTGRQLSRTVQVYVITPNE
jgi:outer membrane protein OmpA-like peptidoglycan-associated protein